MGVCFIHLHEEAAVHRLGFPVPPRFYLVRGEGLWIGARVGIRGKIYLSSTRFSKPSIRPWVERNSLTGLIGKADQLGYLFGASSIPTPRKGCLASRIAA